MDIALLLMNHKSDIIIDGTRSMQLHDISTV